MTVMQVKKQASHLIGTSLSESPLVSWTAGFLYVHVLYMYEQLMNHIAPNKRHAYIDVIQSNASTVQNAFQPIPGLTGCAGVTGRFNTLI